MGLFDKIRHLFAGAAPPVPPSMPPSIPPLAPAAPPQPLVEPDAVETMPPPEEGQEGWDSDAAEESYRARDRYWASIGRVESDVLTHLISPGLTGGPAWPTTRQAFRVIRREGTTIIATDGLSDPFDGVRGGGNGYRMELFIETADIDPALAGEPGDISRLGQSWAFELLQQVSGTVANAAGITHQLDRHRVLSMEIPGFSQAHVLPAQLPARFATADDSLGVLLGQPAPDFPLEVPGMPLSPVVMVPVVLVTASELEFLRAGGAEARRDLAARLGATQAGHGSSLTRAAVV